MNNNDERKVSSIQLTAGCWEMLAPKGVGTALMQAKYLVCKKLTIFARSVSARRFAVCGAREESDGCARVPYSVRTSQFCE